MRHKIIKCEEEWKALLTPEQFEICRNQGTERPFTGEYHDCKEEGDYDCVCCGSPLFASGDKYDSGTGWPSFSAPTEQEQIGLREDDSFGMRRVEVLCAVCEAHLGHVFDDGPSPTNKRYCINSAALKLRK